MCQSRIKYLLNSRIAGKACPVVIAIPLYESFFSWSTAETGWVTLPIPGEAIVGYHAMLVVGYDDERKLFLVRNSWGPNWAHKHDKGYNGHAWIPYEYISRFCDTGATLTNLNLGKINIPEQDRLYFRKTRNLRRKKHPVSSKRNSKSRRASAGKITFTGWLIRAAVLVLLWVAYREPIMRIKESIVTYFHENADLTALRENAAEKLNELNN